MKFQGLLTPKEERWLARFMDKLTPLDSKILEGGDYLFYRNVIRLIDNLIVGKLIPANWVHPLRKIIELARVNDVKAIGEMLSGTVAGKVDVPFLNENGEKAVFLHAYGLIEAKIYELLQKANQITVK
jgi:hypothetical protein